MNATESKVRQGEHEAQNALDDQRAGKAEGRGGRDTVPKERGKKEGQLGKQQNGTKRRKNRIRGMRRGIRKKWGIGWVTRTGGR